METSSRQHPIIHREWNFFMNRKLPTMSLLVFQNFQHNKKFLMLQRNEQLTFTSVWFRKHCRILDSLIHNLNTNNCCPGEMQSAWGSFGSISTDRISWNYGSMQSICTVWDKIRLQIIMRTNIKFLPKPWPHPINLKRKRVTRTASAVGR